MEGDLRIARPVARLGRRDGLRLTELVDLHNPGNDGAACRLPDQTCREPAGQREAAEKGQPPVPCLDAGRPDPIVPYRSEEHTSELQSLMRISYAVFCLKKKKNI